MSNVIYYGDWHNWFICSVCDHEYGKEDPLHKYFNQCCPSCGSKSDSYSPPVIRTSRRFVCTYKPTILKRIFMLHKDTGYFEFKGVDESGSYGPLKYPRPKLNKTAIFAAASIIN